MTDPLLLPAILQLPQELLDDILSLLDNHHDLINFALASKACTRLVIPRHSEYRVIRTRYILPHVWEHLARRADLARNIRQVCICLRIDYTASDHLPATLLKNTASPSLADAEVHQATARNMGVALSHMQHLQAFDWTWDTSVTSDPYQKLAYEYHVFDALRRLSNLSHLALQNAFLLRFPKDVEANCTYPLWNISSLTTLRLEGSDWTRPNIVPHVLSLLHNSPNMLHLDLPMEFRLGDSLTFPKLESLRMTLQSGVTSIVDVFCARFLRRHPTIKRLLWTPFYIEDSDSMFPPDCLPNLQLLRTTNAVIWALSKGTCIRHITSLELQDVNRPFLAALVCFDKSCLRKLKIRSFDTIGTLRALAVTFSGITHLSLPPYTSYDYCPNVDIESWIELLAIFTRLEVLHGQFLWRAIGWDNSRMHAVIHRLVDLCPQLQALDHQQYHQKRCGYNIIVIIRQVDEEAVEHVTYRIEKPEPRRPFDQFEQDL